MTQHTFPEQRSDGFPASQATASVAAVIFDLDGVLVDTADRHLRAWRDLASAYGFELPEEIGESLKGVSRPAALERVMAAGGRSLDADEAERAAAWKNARYLDMLRSVDATDLLPGAEQSLDWLRSHDVPVALASASRNARAILSATGIDEYFHAIVDGTMVQLAKPDPAVFLKAAQELRVDAGRALVIEDAIAGVEGARRAGMQTVGIGDPAVLVDADLVIPNLTHADWPSLLRHNRIESKEKR